MLFCQGLEDVAVVRGHCRAGPRRDGTFGKALELIRDDQGRVHLEHGAQPGTGRAGTPRAIERELPGLHLIQRDVVTVRAGQPFTEAARPVRVIAVPLYEVENDQPVGQPQRGLDRVGDALLGGRLDRHPVDDHVDVMLALLVEGGRVSQLVGLTVDADPCVAVTGQRAEDLAVLALAASDHRRQHLESGALRQLEHLVDDLLGRLTADQLPTDQTRGVADAGEQQPQVVVDLGDRADGRPRISAGGLLVDRHSRRQALDEVDRWLVHLAEELPRIGGQRLDVAALSLGEDGVEGQGRLARSRQPGEDNQRVLRQVEGDIAQIVFPSTGDSESILHVLHGMRPR